MSRTWFSPSPCHFLSLRSTHSPQRPLLNKLHFMLWSRDRCHYKQEHICSYVAVISISDIRIEDNILIMRPRLSYTHLFYWIAQGSIAAGPRQQQFLNSSPDVSHHQIYVSANGAFPSTRGGAWSEGVPHVVRTSSPALTHGR